MIDLKVTHDKGEITLVDIDNDFTLEDGILQYTFQNRGGSQWKGWVHHVCKIEPVIIDETKKESYVVKKNPWLFKNSTPL